jgi:Sulfotransferase domain
VSDALPNLLVAGVPKAGTSSLFRYLIQHPDICGSDVKEVRYFNPLRQEGGNLPEVEWYKHHFENWNGERYLLEATPGYCYGGRALLEGIKSTLGSPRIIIILRDPVDRLWSAYMFRRSHGHLRGVKSFEHYVSICEEKRRKGEKQGPHFGGITVSLYGDYLPTLFDVFEDIKVVFTERMAADPAAVVSDISRWLEIDDAIPVTFDYGRENATAHPKSLLLTRWAKGTRDAAEGILQRAPAIKNRLRKSYLKLNTTSRAPEVLAEGTRRRLEIMFQQSNATVASLLSDKGYDDLPTWLLPPVTAPQS